MLPGPRTGVLQDWKSAVQMYRQANQWEDALRVAKVYGGINASKQVAYAWALTLGEHTHRAVARQPQRAHGRGCGRQRACMDAYTATTYCCGTAGRASPHEATCIWRVLRLKPNTPTT
jgi:hypothetical protein